MSKQTTLTLGNVARKTTTKAAPKPEGLALNAGLASVILASMEDDAPKGDYAAIAQHVRRYRAETDAEARISAFAPGVEFTVTAEHLATAAILGYAATGIYPNLYTVSAVETRQAKPRAGKPGAEYVVPMLWAAI